MISIWACVLWCIASASYVACVILFYFAFYKEEDFTGESLWYISLIHALFFFPGINQLFAVILLLAGIAEFISNKLKPLSKKIEKIKKRREYLKERKRKIKLGIIKITPNNPYGEENYEDEI